MREEEPARATRLDQLAFPSGGILLTNKNNNPVRRHSLGVLLFRTRGLPPGRTKVPSVICVVTTRCARSSSPSMTRHLFGHGLKPRPESHSKLPVPLTRAAGPISSWTKQFELP